MVTTGFKSVLATLLLFASSVSAVCFNPEPARRICYSDPGATPQNLSLTEIDFTAKYLRFYGSQHGNPQLYIMNGTGADKCAEWLVTSKGSTSILAKLVGRYWAAVSFNDIANTIDGGVDASGAQRNASLTGCQTAGGQMGVIVNQSDPAYKSPDFVNGGLKNEGILLKIVRTADGSLKV